MITSTERQKLSSIETIVNPEALPEAGFQSYEQFVNNGALEQKEDFLAGKIRNPHFSHSKFRDINHLDRGIVHLGVALEQAGWMVEEGLLREAFRSSLEFRQAEMEYVKLLAQIEYLANERPDDLATIRETAERARELGYELYGRIDADIRDMALNELWSMLDGKEYRPSAQQLFDDLKNGFDFQGEAVAPLPRANNPELRLPRFENNAALEWAGEMVIEMNADIQALINEYWEQAVAEHGENYVCNPEDIVDVFQKVIDMRDPEGKSGVSVKLVEGKTALSWESPEMSVHVGSKRAPIVNKGELFRKVLHEFGVHGQRAINGLKTKLPTLGMGLFTNTVRPDGLTFEEGFATTVEDMIGDELPKWNAAKLGHYLNLALVESGADYRSVFETAWRYRLLSSLEPNQEVTADMIKKAKSAAYTACNRIFRGTQPDLREKTGVGIKPLVFGKDAAYLAGRVLAMGHLEYLYERRDVAGVGRLFAGKFDPTNPVQAEIMKLALAT